MTPRHVVMFSSGAGSWAAARRVADQHGTDGLVLLFADVRGEDEDNYRFLEDAAADIGGQLVTVADGRTIWDVFRDRRFLGNSRIANCSTELKQKPARAWMDANAGPDTVVHVGIDVTEVHRLPAIERGWAPWRTTAPLCEPPYLSRGAVFAAMKARGLRRPRLYDLGMAHANCSGGCVRAGQGQFTRLLEFLPDKFAEWEANEENLRQHLDRDDVSILKDRTLEGILAHLGLTKADVERRVVTPAHYDEDAADWRTSVTAWFVKTTGERLPDAVPLRLTVLRERAESRPEQIDLFDVGGCGCFVAEEIA
jgi:hypothetical protein